MPSTFTLNVLLFGNFPELATRCLSSLLPVLESGRERVESVRLGLNRISPATGEVVDAWCRKCPVPGIVIAPEHPNAILGKYPMMRRMFMAEPMNSDYVMWFDDDSHVKPSATHVLLQEIDEIFLRNAGVAMVGELYTMHPQGNQRKWVTTRPWYRGKPLERYRFATGGWWTIRRSVLEALGWPDPQINHNGGDTNLGEALRQNDLLIHPYKGRVVVNDGARRGISQTPAGATCDSNGVSQPVPCNDFSYRVEHFGG